MLATVLETSWAGGGGGGGGGVMEDAQYTKIKPNSKI